MTHQTCRNAKHKLSPLTEQEINGVKMADGTIDTSTIIGKKGDSVCVRCSKVFRTLKPKK